MNSDFTWLDVGITPVSRRYVAGFRTVKCWFFYLQTPFKLYAGDVNRYLTEENLSEDFWTIRIVEI